MSEDLARLAARYGIASEYYDIWGGRHVTTEHTCCALLRAMGRSCSPQCADPDSPASRDQALIVAIHAYLARALSQVMMVRPEDVLGLDSQANLPGGRNDQHPNWRRRLALDIEDWPSDRRFVELRDALGREHRCATLSHETTIAA